MRKPIPYYYPGKFSPPNKYDLSIAKWLSRKTFDVSNVIIVVGKFPTDIMPVELKVELWQDFLSQNKEADISVIADKDNSPLTTVYKIQERSKEDAFGVAVPESLAKNEDFKTTFSVFPNYEVILTPTYSVEDASAVTRALEQDDFKTYSKYMPDFMSVEEKFEMFKKSKPKPEDPAPMLFESYLREAAKNIVNKVKSL